jgi:DNA repair protein SbcD/Mre11
MARFLHVADVHLGFDRYDCKARSLDFFYAFQDAIERYAIADAVDFVIIAGDLFEHRMILPAVLSQAQICLTMLQTAGIPAIAIEGNHDNRPFGTKTSWLRYLADQELLILLEPEADDATGLVYEPWDGRKGGYIDLPCGVRILGSSWYGANAPRAIAQITTAMQSLPPAPAHTIMLFHHGLEGQISRYAGALRYVDVLPLKASGVDYLALGHIHKNYEVEGWIFNPGSIEANSIEESQYQRGVYQVELTPKGIQPQLKTDYLQRSIHRLKLKLTGQETAEGVFQSAIAQIQAAITSEEIVPDDEPIVELRIEGQAGFDHLDLNQRELQAQLKATSHALIFLLRWDAESTAYISPIADQAERLEIEREVFTDLLTAHSSYKRQAPELAQGLLNLKSLQLEERPLEEIYDFAQDLLR